MTHKRPPAFKKIVVSAGHNSRRVGAQALGHKEHHLNLMVARGIVEYLEEQGFPVILLDPGLSLQERVASVTGLGPDVLGLEIHFNSFNGRASGTEMFYRAGDKRSFDLGKPLVELLSQEAGIPNRGMKLASMSARGSLAWLQVPHGLLWEICFMDNSEDMQKVNLPLLGGTIGAWILRHL